jgi:hypothetical protein
MFNDNSILIDGRLCINISIIKEFDCEDAIKVIATEWLTSITEQRPSKTSKVQGRLLICWCYIEYMHVGNAFRRYVQWLFSNFKSTY